jgi:hypothetical protein
MAWTAPKTFLASSSLTAADLNTYVRDNLLETIAAKATDNGGLFTSSGTNAVAERLAKKSFISTEQTTTSTAYTDLATAGPSVTVTSGPGGALAFWCSRALNSTTGYSIVSLAITGAAGANAAAAASDDRELSSNRNRQYSQVVYYDGLTAGSNTFTMKYRVTAGTGTFSRRRLIVFPM